LINTEEKQGFHSIETVNLTKVFAKKKHRGILSFLRKNTEKERSKNEKSEALTVALDHVNLKVQTGELFGLLGPNGAGKTTLVKCLATILIPDEGTALVNGCDVLKETTMVRASIGLVVGGERTLYWKLTARDNLMYFASLYKMPRAEAKDRVNQLLETMGLLDRADERLEDYSTGMRQKIAIARALLHNPPVLLLDEPTLGLDPTFSRQMRSQIRDLCKDQGKTILLATHYMYEADELCDRIAIMNNGQIAAVDTSNRLKAMVREKELVEVACVNPPIGIEAELKSLCRDVDIVTLIQGDEAESTPARIKIIGEGAEESMGTIIDALRKKKVQITSLNVGMPTLEDAFIKLTGGAKLTEGGEAERERHGAE